MELRHETEGLKPGTGKNTERLDAASPADVARAAQILRDGGIVAFPTETVYGLGANALDASAVEKIFVAKKRPHWDPLIVHITDREMLAKVTERSREQARIDALMQTFWPGPLTLLLPRTAVVPDIVTAGRALVGVRMPAHPVALDLIRRAGVPIAAPSANVFGHTSPTTADHVLDDLDGRIDAVLDGGATSVGLESTVVGPYSDPDEFFNHGFVVYRAGAITLDMIKSISGTGAVHYHVPDERSDVQSAHASPGLDLRHYAPRARLLLVDGLEMIRSVVGDGLVHAIDQAIDGVRVIGVMLPDGWNSSCAQLVYRWGPWSDGETLARRLFAGLRELDDRGATVIVCPVPTISGIGEAIRDRLQKAARA